MRTIFRSRWIFLTLVCASLSALADEQPAADAGVRILSWNISDDAFVKEHEEFSSLLLWADPDIVLLDEVAPSADVAKLHLALASLRSGDDEVWNVNVGISGGRQRCAVASRAPQEVVPEFSSIIPYPEADKRQILEHMSKLERSNSNFSMEYGIPVNAAVVVTGGRRLLTVIVDLQCCGDDPESWQEYRRRTEVREIRRLVRQVLERTTVDGIIIAGDFNLVNGATPLVLLAGPYAAPHAGLISAELYHADGASTWTWDGRGTPFPSNTLDFQLYSPHSLEMRSGIILDTAVLPSEMLEQYGFESITSRRTGRHHPLLVEYRWN
jgi:hypothetical protein